MLFFIHRSFGIGLNVYFLKNLFRYDYFDNICIVENVVQYLFVIGLDQFLLHNFIVILVMFHLLQGKVLYFGGISTVVFRVINSSGVFLLRVSGIARFFPAVQTICMFGNFTKIS